MGSHHVHGRASKTSPAGDSDEFSSKQRAAGLHLVSSITLHSMAGTQNIDAITVGFNDSGSEVLGSVYAAYKGKAHASLSMWAEDRVRALYIWADKGQLAIQGLMLVLARGAVLDMSFNLDPTLATLRRDRVGDFGSGLLLGITGSTRPVSEVLSAVAFTMLKAPVSAALAVDMPSIDIEGAAFTPRADVKYKFANTGVSTVKGGCPEYTQTTATNVRYTQATDVQRLGALINSIGIPRDTKTWNYKTAVSLEAAERQVLKTGEVVTNTWSSQVRNQLQRGPVLQGL